MTNERFDNDLPNIVLDKEDREAFQKSRANQKKPSPVEENTSTNKSGLSGMWLVLVFIVALSSAGANYWLYQQKLASDAALNSAVDRVTELERRLSATGEEMDQSAGALRVTVSELTEKTDELWNQMDKLWASAWRKNQAEITQLNERLNQTENQTNRKMGLVESDVVTVTTNLAVLQEQLTQQRDELAQLSTLLVEMRSSDTDNARQIGDIKAKLVTLDQVNGALSRRLAKLEKWRKDTPTPAFPTNP
ncbi:hypothetical protein OAP14_02700 [Aliiglaciecola sp.]|nr:hypothetical protein [Aliiglaciecola sp.]